MAVLAVMFLGLNAQTVVRKDSLGVYRAAVKVKTTTTDTKSGKYVDAKGNVYDIYTGSKGGKYIWKVRKDGSKYKSYLKLEN